MAGEFRGMHKSSKTSLILSASICLARSISSRVDDGRRLVPEDSTTHQCFSMSNLHLSFSLEVLLGENLVSIRDQDSASTGRGWTRAEGSSDGVDLGEKYPLAMGVAL